MIAEELVNSIHNKWHNVYWFARILINNDKYVAIGKEPRLLSALASSLRLLSKEQQDGDVLMLQKQTIRHILEERYSRTSSLSIRLRRLIDELNAEINTQDDMNVFILTCESIMLPLHQAISNIPNDDKEFTLNIAKSYLDIKGEKGLATVISFWDDLGVKGCLTAERTEIIRAFSSLRLLLSKDRAITDEDKDIVLSAFTQEFERRAAQKRKKRAGGSLEDVTDFILDYYKVPKADKPEHFQADIEVDNWIKTNDGWLIGISCKRTLRERWKQVSSADASILSKFKIKYLYHVVTYDEDLSDEKLALLGSQRHIFYLPDNSRKLKHASEHVGLKAYVRPISQIINDIKKETK